MNLFEQQAQALRAARPASAQTHPVPSHTVPSRPAQFPSSRPVALPEVLRFVERASLSHCAQLARGLSARLYTLEKSHAGMQAANIEEAAQFASDAALNIESVPGIEAGKPCACGRCDDCLAARADENYARGRDGTLAGQG